MTEVRTTCPYCGVGCGVTAGAAGLRGDAAHPANRGRLCSKGSALADTLDLDDRLLFPEMDGRRTGWDQALDAVARRFAGTIAEHGPDSVAFYVSGQLLTEDYYVANKLMKGFIGSANIDTNSRLCMASAVAAHRRAFGADLVPGCYDDLDEADLIVLVGSNAAWCHPILHRRIRAARERGARVVVIDPRRTATCEDADLHLALRPGTDAALFAGLLAHLAESPALDRGFVEHATSGFGDALARARDLCPDAASVAAVCDLDEADVALFFAWFAGTPRTVTAWSQGVNQSVAGTDGGNAIINCHLATGRIGRPGAAPLSLTGQPNAMGGREVGGLANQLAAHMDFDPESRDRVGRFWNAPALAKAPGLKAVDLFDAVADGRVKALWVMATNPAASLPRADAVARAIEACPFVVVSDCVRRTDTARRADVLLPAATWGEKDGTVTNSERRISRQRAFRTAPGEARPDWWIVTQVARRMGWGNAFPYERPSQVFREHAALTAFENGGTRLLDLGGLAELDDRAYDALAPVQWPVRATGTDMGTGTARLFADGRFGTPGGRARFVPAGSDPARPAAPVRDPDFPLVLNTGRLRDQWHTMTRTGTAPRLWAHAPEPVCEVGPADAARAGLDDGGFARLAGPHGGALVRVAVTEGQRPGEVFLPIHWSRSTSAAGGAAPLASSATDPVSGQPDLKRGAVRIEAWHPAWRGFLVSRRPAEPPESGYWSRWRAGDCHVLALAGDAGCPAESLPEGSAGGIEFHDPGRGVHRWARFDAGRLDACLFVGPDTATAPDRWLLDLFGQERVTRQDRRWLLSGRSPSGTADAGPLLCACLGVPRNQVLQAVRERGIDTIEGIGEALGAGTGCGSCISELKELIAHARHASAA